MFDSSLRATFIFAQKFKKMSDNIRLTIGEFSRFCQVSVKTLRHYERMGLLVPHEVDEWTGYRHYSVSQMQQLNGILRLKEMGFSLEEVRALLDEGTDKPSIKQVEEKIQQTEALITSLQRRLLILHRVADQQTQINNSDKIYIQSLPSIIVASHRQIIANRQELTSLCANIIGPAIQHTGCRRTLPIYSFNVEYEDEYKTENIDIEYCEQVEEMMDDTEFIKFKCLPAIPIAICMKCYGPYRLQESFAELFQFINEQGYQISGLHRTQYVEGAWNQKDPEKWLTIIQVPVTPAQ